MAYESRMVTPGYGLHPYQRQVAADVLQRLVAPEREVVLPKRRVIAHLPTGAGKTRIASSVACHLLNRRDDDALVVWLASAEELCEQAAEELERAWSCLGNRETRMHRYWGDFDLALRDMPGGFLVAGLAKLREAAARDRSLLAHLSASAAGVIFDEAHQAVAPTYAFVTEQLLTDRPPLLGLTATPGRTAQITDEDEALAEMFNREKVSIDPRGHGNPVTFLITNGYLADPRFIRVEVDSDVSAPEPSGGDDYDHDILEALGEDARRTEKVVEITAKALLRHPRVLVFCPSVRNAEQCHRRMRELGLRSQVVTANTPRERRKALIEAFRSEGGDRLALFNYGVLTAGLYALRHICDSGGAGARGGCPIWGDSCVGRFPVGSRFRGNDVAAWGLGDGARCAPSWRYRAEWIPAYAGMTVGYAKVSRHRERGQRGRFPPTRE